MARRRKPPLTAYKELASSFRKGAFKPIYLVYGAEVYLAMQAQRLMTEHALKGEDRDFSLDVVYGTETDVDQVINLCATVPMLGGRRVIVVREFDKLKNARRFATYCKAPNPYSVVWLACTGKPRFNMHPYKALKAAAECVEFSEMYPREVPRFVQAQARLQGKKVEQDAARLIVDLAGNALANVANEVDKLSVFVGERDTIERGDVLGACGQSREANVFDLQDLIAAGNAARAHRVANQLLNTASNPRSEALAMVAILATFYTRLWVLRGIEHRRYSNADAEKLTGMPRFRLAAARDIVRRWPPTVFDQAFTALLAADAELKGLSGRSERLVITLLLNQLIRAGGI